MIAGYVSPYGSQPTSYTGLIIGVVVLICVTAVFITFLLRSRR